MDNLSLFILDILFTASPIIAFGGGVYLLYKYFFALRKKMIKETWQRTNGTVTDSRVDFIKKGVEGKIIKIYELIVSFSYQVDDKTHDVNEFRLGDLTKSVAHKHLSKLQTHKQVPLLINPKQPEKFQIDLETGDVESSQGLGSLIVGILLVISGIWFSYIFYILR